MAAACSCYRGALGAKGRRAGFNPTLFRQADRGFQAMSITLEEWRSNAVGVVEDPVEDGVAEGGITDNGVPVVDGTWLTSGGRSGRRGDRDVLDLRVRRGPSRQG